MRRPLTLLGFQLALALCLASGCGGAAAGSASPADSPAGPPEVVLAPAPPPSAAAVPEEPTELAALLAPESGEEEESGDQAASSATADPLGGEPTGGLIGDDVPSALGAGGLGLSGLGLGAGGLGGIGTLGGGLATGSGFGDSSGRLGGARAQASTVTTPLPGVTGNLPPEVVRRVVRTSVSRMRYCYEKGLRKNATLAGNVTVTFVIGVDGAVASAQSSSTLADPEVEACVVAIFRSMLFPKPNGGLVQVRYPLELRPAAAPDAASPAPTSPASTKPSEGPK
jgi:hypothetical protein